MKALQTRMLGYAPDERDREYPPEVVYWTERAPKPWYQSWWMKAYIVGAFAFFGWLAFGALNQAMTEGVPDWIIAWYSIIVAVFMLDWTIRDRRSREGR
jgi:hypothetical protein